MTGATAALATSPDFVVRPATDDDLNYVRKTWLREYAEESDWIDEVGGGVFFREHPTCIEAAFRRGAVTIACRSSVPSGICGFAVTEEGAPGLAQWHPEGVGRALVHFIYVKHRWRQLGVARLLLAPFAAVPVEYTHRTHMLARLRVPEAWTFNPYPFLRSA